MNNNEVKMLKEFETILKNNGKDNPFENRILAKIIRTIKQLIQLKEENEQLTQKLEKARELLSKSIHLECEICPKEHKDYDCSAGDCIDISDDLAQQALKELEKPTASDISKLSQELGITNLKAKDCERIEE